MSTRYTVGSVTGHKINPNAMSAYGNARPPKPLWYVYDSAYCYRALLETWDETEARALAAELNEKDERG